ncbi:MAG: transglutaminase domain-containing protein [Gemmataceae bacterium]|nr:transglutaminase domain-containing protein [Gemmataceae bacterium]
MRIIVVVLALLPTLAFAVEPKTRIFRFSYETTVTGLEPNQEARIWLPVPQPSDDQDVLSTDLEFPTKPTLSTEPDFGNKMYCLTANASDAGEISLKAIYTIKRKEVVGETDRALRTGLDKFLKADPLTPENGKHIKLLEGKKLPADAMGKARECYQIVNGLMRYAKAGTEWGRGDVNWVCDSKFGNCTDFHSLFNALIRSQKIPARFEIGFSIPTMRGSGEVAGYHCWAKFNPEGKGWVPVDISEANKNPKLADYYFGNLTEDRVTFSTGRGLTLSPKQEGPPLNFFVYPYVEVAGKEYPAAKVKRKFGYEDVSAKN